MKTEKRSEITRTDITKLAADAIVKTANDSAVGGGGVDAAIHPHFRSVWENCVTQEERNALRLYFLPHRSLKSILGPTRPRVIKWYCPFAYQAVFPAGHRYCINVYTGCSHRCHYCYAAAYEPAQAAGKREFSRLLAKDLADLERFNVPPAPVHIANSTDPFQPLEERAGDTKRTLEGLIAHRRRFSTVTILTKNPSLASRPPYLGLLNALAEAPSDHPFAARWSELNHPALQVEVSLAFWREEAAAFWEPGAPSVARRIEGIRALRDVGIPVVLRIDPLFPRSPLHHTHRQSLSDFGLIEAQTQDDIESLISFAGEVGSRHVVYSPAKIVMPRRLGLTAPMRNLLQVYRQLSAPEKPVWRGGSWRLPQSVAQQWVLDPFRKTCDRHSLLAKFCMQNLIETI